MVAKVTDPQVRVSMDPSKYEAGADRVTLSTKRMVAAQLAEERKWRAMLGQQAQAIAMEEARQKQLADAVEAAEKRKQKALDTTGRAAGVGGTALLTGLALSAREAIGWQTAWAGVTKTVNGSDTEMAQLEKDLRAMTAVLPASHDDIAAVAEAAGQLGIARQDIVPFTKTMIDLATSTNLSADEAATSIAQLMNIMQTAPGEVGNLGASLVALGNNGASTERDIVQMAQRIAGAGRTVGLTTAQVLGIANAVASVGIEVEAGGSAISNVLIDVSKSVAQNGSGLQKWAAVAGMSAQQFAATWKSTPADGLNAVITGLGRLNAAGGDVFGTLSDLGETDIRVTRTLLSMANAGDLLSSSLQLGTDAWKANTALVQEASKRYDTAASRMKMAKNSIDDAAISIGESFLPIIADGAGTVADFAKWIGSLPEPVLHVAAVLGAVSGAVLVTGGAALWALPKWKAFTETLSTLRAAAPGTATVLGKVTSALGKLSLAVAAVGTVTAVIDTSNADASERTITQYTKALLNLKEASKAGGTGPIADLKQAFDLTQGKGDAAAKVLDVLSNVNRLGGGKTNTGEIRDRFAGIGQALAAMYDSSPDLAAAKFNEILQITGGTTDQLLNLLPAYRDRLQDVANAQSTAGKSADGMTKRYNAATDATQELTDEQVKYLDSIAQSDAAMVSVGDAYTSAIEEQKAAAQARADAQNKAADDAEEAARKQGRSLKIARKDWSDYYDGRTVSVDQYLKHLQEQVTTQTQWESDLLKLAGRGVDQGTLDQLRTQGVSFAPMVHALANGSDAQLAKLKQLAAQGGATASGEFADQLTSGVPVLQAAGDKLGAAALDAIVKRLTDGKATLQQIIDQYGLIVAGMPTTEQKQRQNPWWGPMAPGYGGPLEFGKSATPSVPSSYKAGTPNPGQPVQVLPVPVPIQSLAKPDLSTNFFGPVTFTDPSAASSQAAKARANTTGRRQGGPTL